MANSFEIIDYKQKIASMLINNEDIVRLINNTDIESPEELIGENIFNFMRYPDSVEHEITYICFEVEVPKISNTNYLFKQLVITFYVITHALSNKMQHIEKNPAVAICGDWFTAHGTGENLGHILDDKNKVISDKLRNAFASWYNNGHTNEADPNTCILCIHLTDGVLLSHGTRYYIDFT